MGLWESTKWPSSWAMENLRRATRAATYGFMHGSLFLRFFQPIAQGAKREDKAVGQELPAFGRQALRRFVGSEYSGGKAAPADEFSQD